MAVGTRAGRIATEMSRRATNLTESIDWELRQVNPVLKTLNFAERVSLAVEKPYSG